MGALIPLLTTLISEAPSVVNLILSILHPDGSQTILVTLSNADTNNAVAMTAIQQLQAAIAAKNAQHAVVVPHA